jgi:hypothetical protein
MTISALTWSGANSLRPRSPPPPHRKVVEGIPNDDPAVTREGPRDPRLVSRHITLKDVPSHGFDGVHDLLYVFDYPKGPPLARS